MLHMSLGSEEQPVILVTTLVVKLWVMALQMLVFHLLTMRPLFVRIFKCLKNPSRKTERSCKHMHFRCLNV